MRLALRVLVAIVGVAGLSVAARLGTPPAGAQEPSGITPPAQWAEWDANGDGVLSVDEYEEMSEADRQALQDWIDITLDAVDDNEFRDWASQHFDWEVRFFHLDIPSPGALDGIRDAPGEIQDAVTGAARDLAGGVADSAFDSVARRVGEAAADLTGYLGDEMARTGRPQLEAEWYREHYQRMLGWAGLLVLPLAMAAIGGAVVQGDTAKVGHTLMQVPIAYLLGVLAVSLISAVTGLAAAMSRSLVPGMQESSHDLAARVTELSERQLSPGPLLLVGLVIAVAAMASAIWLIFAEGATYAVVLFIPLAFAGRVWEPAREWGRKLMTLALSLVAAKVVIFAIWALAVDGLAEASAGDVPLRSALALASLLMMTALAPTAALRLVPLVEGVDRAGSPGAAARTAMSNTYYARGLARQGSASLGSGRGGGGGGGLAVTSAIGGAAARAPTGVGPGAPTDSQSARPPQRRPDRQPAAPDGQASPPSSPSSAPGPGDRSRSRGEGSQPARTSTSQLPGGSSTSPTSTARVAPPAPPPGVGKGRLWQRRDR